MLMFSVGDIHEYESCLDLLIFNCKNIWLLETRVFYRPDLYFLILGNFLGSFYHLVITFLILFFFYLNLSKQSLQFVKNHIFALVCIFHFFFGIWIIGEIINFIVLAATIITEKIDNYRYNNSLVKEKIIFITIITNSVEKIVLSRS